MAGGTFLRPGNCADCGAALDTARRTYCTDCADLRRQRSNAEADRRRRQADRDRRNRPATTVPDGGVVLPAATVRLLVLQLTLLRDTVRARQENWNAVQDLYTGEGPTRTAAVDELDAEIELAEAEHLNVTLATAEAAEEFLAAARGLLPPEVLPD